MFRRTGIDKIKYIYVSNLPSFWWEDFVDMELQILSCRADGFVCWLSYASTNKCPDSLRFFCKMLFKNSSVDEKPNALAFWQ